MLCKINVNPSGATGGSYNMNGDRMLNFLTCIAAIATAPAGSTPSSNGAWRAMTSWSTAKDVANGGECITVIDNTEAGGWLIGPPSGSYEAILPETTSLVSSNYYQTYIYQNTGRANPTHAGIKFATAGRNTASTTFGNSTYMSDDSYSLLDWYYGTSNGATAGTNPNGCAATSQATSGGNSQYHNWANNPTYFSMYPQDEEQNTFYIASTSDYFMVIGAGGMIYFGKRDQSLYESQRPDMVEYVGFNYSNNATGGHAGSITASGHNGTIGGAVCNQSWFGGAGHFMYYINYNLDTGSYVEPPSVYSYNRQMMNRVTTTNNGDSEQICIISGYSNGGVSFNPAQRSQVYGSSTSTGAVIKLPIMPIRSGWGPFTGPARVGYRIAYKSSTSEEWLPMASPVIFESCAPNNSNYIGSVGKAKGILCGPSASEANLNTVFGTNTEFDVDGQTYYAVRTGSSIRGRVLSNTIRDVILVKKA